ncbi:neuroligin-1-like isoform X2 [Argiope bruennichi]|uniref:neuroligin-1-like isoform X2 n=1 Tax=Argiope bruennichi TaxID=94029 RepID=UPI00249498B1|nr:neuroligin-1-like isoform X2 [Argiope bruennichi]
MNSIKENILNRQNCFLEKMRITFLIIALFFTNVVDSINQMELDSRHLSTRVVHTRYGTLRGFISTLSNRELQPVEVFLGVPYAGAPTGALRFMPPVTSPHWKGVRLADSYGSVCPQKWPDIKNETEALKRMPLGRLRYLQRLLPMLFNQSEDCLYLNIFAPAFVGRQPRRLPVMVYIHGESYEWNAGNPYDGRVLSSYGNVIVITINYRLGVLGLFHRAIMHSGSALCPWAIAKDAISHTQKLAQRLNCSMQDSMMLIECLRKRRLEDIMSVDIAAPDHLTAFGPTVDGIVLSHDPIYLMETKPDLFLRYNLMLGITKVESYFAFSAVEEVVGIDSHRRDRVLRTLVRNLYTHHLQQIFLTVVNEYMDWSVPHLHSTDIFRGTVEAMSDATVASILIKTAMFHSNPNLPTDSPFYMFFIPTKTYFYVFGHQTEEGDYATRLGCITGEDLAYVFGAPLVASLAHFPSNFTAEEASLSETTMMYWTSFAKFGDPNLGTQLGEMQIDPTRGLYERVIWPEFTSNLQKYLSILIRPKVKDHYNAHKLSYWLNLIPKLDSIDNATTDQHHMLEDHHNASMYDGCVRSLYADVEQKTEKQTIEDSSQMTNTSEILDTDKAMSANVTEVQVYGLDKGAHLSALGVTIAVGCSLLMLNAVVFAAIFYQKDKINVAKNMHKAFYEVERNKEEEEDAFKKPYLLKDAPSSLILHDFEPIQAYKEQPIFDLVETNEIKRQLSGTAETELTNTSSKPAKIKTVTFVEAPTILCELPDPTVPGTPSQKCQDQRAFHPSQSKESECASNS